MNSFTILHQNYLGRAGVINTISGQIKTPAYVPVATNAAIKTCDSVIIDEIGVDLLFVNTYHMLVHPGVSIIKNAGGLHTFMQRKNPIISDSGGFQIFSLKYGGVSKELKSKGKKESNNSVLKVTEEGVLFRSYLNGKKIFISPESTIQAQKDMDSDIIIPLDELLPLHIDEKYFKTSFDKTHRWQLRSLAEHKKNPDGRLIYAVIHGGTSMEYRKKSAKLLAAYDFDGFAIGGSLGKTTEDVYTIVKETLQWLPPDKPRHLLGISDLQTIKAVLPLGIDTFDSSYPTKCARHGWLFNDESIIKIKQSKWTDCHNSFSPGCSRIYQYSFSYLHHLFKSHEQAAGLLSSIHNIWYLNDLTKRIRERIAK